MLGESSVSCVTCVRRERAVSVSTVNFVKGENANCVRSERLVSCEWQLRELCDTLLYDF